MSTSAIIRICEGNTETAAVCLSSDGYPSFARDQLLAGVANVCSLWQTKSTNTKSVLAAIESVLEILYAETLKASSSVRSRPRQVKDLYTTFPSFKRAEEYFGGVSYQYTVHIVDGKIYY